MFPLLLKIPLLPGLVGEVHIQFPLPSSKVEHRIKMLSFDEFRAVNQREKGKAELGKKVESAAKAASNSSSASSNNTKDNTNNSKNTENDENLTPNKNKSKSATQMLGDVLELQSTQTLYIVMLILDTFAALAELGILSNQIPSKMFPGVISQVLHLLKLFSKFNMIVFSVEIFLVYLAFGLATIRHFGYLIDFLVITSQLTLDYYGIGRVNRLLNIFRVWRPIRLLSAIIAEERERRDEVKQQVEAKEEEIKACKEEIDSVKEELSKEKSARESIETMLQNYKEEVDTLNEALKIAAMDIAEVAQADDEFLTDDDDENHDEATLSSRADSTQSKASKLRAALGDNVSVDGKASTFVIYEDGAFEKK